ncbi:GNAT family N-acetyltransferase [Rhizobium sp. FKL33]|uniref:GNAT family N-acetyltransferase n=1 Tax=Rhizobium sp. FKL33 TaxID=2562307 RepID=UPI001FEF782F|nr:GNAT family N-acetyltransferase [Rhizobium sp. FKL33]
MKPPDKVYRFRPMERADLALVGGWLLAPHVSQWWGEAATALEEIDEILDLGLVKPFIGEFLGRPAGYFQAYDPHEDYGHPYADQPAGTLGIDQFIGVAELTGLGHGTAMTRAFCQMLFTEGARRIIADPDAENAAAIKMYEKAGFQRLDQRDTEYGVVLLMHLDAQQETERQ